MRKIRLLFFGHLYRMDDKKVNKAEDVYKRQKETSDSKY